MPLSKEQIEIEHTRFQHWHYLAHSYDSCRLEDGKYSIPHVERRWIVWLACRESIEIIQLDKLWSARGLSDGYNLAVDDSTKFLEAQGFKVKS